MLNRFFEVCGMIEYLLIRRWVLDFDCNRAKINDRMKRLTGDVR